MVLFQGDTVSSAPCIIEKDMVRESISKMKNGEAAGTSSVVLEMVKSAVEVGFDMITDLIK